MEAKAYRNPVHFNETISEIPLKKYRDLAKQIELQCLHANRLFGRATSPDSQIDKLTQDWATNERERFRYWFRNTREANSLTTAESKMVTKTAQYLPHSHQDILDKFKDQRRSTIRRLRRLQNELLDMFEQTGKTVEWSDERYPTPDKKIEAIQNAINQICNLLGTLRTKEVTAAAITRTLGFLKGVDENVAKRVAGVIDEQGGIIKVAARGPIYEIAKKLKQELDGLNYGAHLRRFFHIYESLYKIGLTGIASDIEEIIQKELSSLTGIAKKLSEVYSELLKIPAEDLKKEEQEVKPLNQEQFKTPETVKPEVEAKPEVTPPTPPVAPTAAQIR